MYIINILCLLKFASIKVILILLFFFNTSQANELNYKYNVTTSGIKIGEFNWFLDIKNKKYKTRISLKSAGIFSPIYKFEGEYLANGNFNNQKFETKFYKQYWKTKQKIKIVEMSLDNGLIFLTQDPEEKEFSRVNISELFQYYDPITSFINILNGMDLVNTIDGRRIYTMKKKFLDDGKTIELEINKYKNMWADHKRNDLKKIQFLMTQDQFLPLKIKIYFKDRVFNINKI